jgi:hypothetical protein
VTQERHSILDAPLSVDALVTSQVTLASAGQATHGAIPEGTEFNSYLVQFDPVGTDGGTSNGTITFDGEILGIVFEQSSVVSTDTLLGSIGRYGEATDRGLTLGPEGTLSVSANLHELSFNLTPAECEMVQIRVLTAAVAALSDCDFDHDGDVDGHDFLLWQRGQSPNPLSTVDLADWQNTYGAEEQVPVTASVPEPTTAMLVILALARAHRRRLRD